MEADIGFGLKKPLRPGKPGEGASRRAQGPRRSGRRKASKADGTPDLDPGFEIPALAVQKNKARFLKAISSPSFKMPVTEIRSVSFSNGCRVISAADRGNAHRNNNPAAM
ncbi:hypothetical protein [Rhizobium hidalgonense]|uniref:hypothetical protein n=1 Tax=Rhizobium hidalgonense TaxID=1538159 RepID=UPI002877ECBF|nr:hypothetical protein [Rhizobium hidalgonense]